MNDRRINFIRQVDLPVNTSETVNATSLTDDELCRRNLRGRHGYIVLRRTAVWNLERAGVPRTSAMKLVGHKTQAIYQRYAIADESMLKEAAGKLEQLLANHRDHANGKVSAK